MNTPLRILNLEDSLPDRELVAATLQAEGFDCRFVYAATEPEFREALDQFPFDLILSDFALPSFTGAQALVIARASHPEVPFIFVSGTIGDQRAIETLKQGATDYVLKSHLDRLGTAVRRALREAQDSGERRRAEQQLRVSEERFRQVVENIREVFWLTDPEKKTMFYVSPAYQRIWGRTCESLYQSPGDWIDAIHAEDRPRVVEALENKQRGGEYDETYRIVRPDGSQRWIHDRAFPIRDGAGRIYRIAGVADDITGQRRLEEQLRQSQKMDAIGQLAGGIAHDFNNLLAVIQMNSSLLLGVEEMSATITSGLQDIMAAAERGGSLTRRLLTFSRQEAKQARNLHMAEVIDAMINLLRRILGEDVAIETRFASELPVVHADPGMVEQIIMNLAVNARDAMPSGGRLSVSLESVEVDAARLAGRPGVPPGRFVCLAVSDTGRGIPPEIITRIFEPFFTTKGAGRGTGLGLATVFGIVEQHRGWIEVESEPDRGATFRVYFPAPESAAPSAAIESAPERPVGGHETILLVEDDPCLRNVARIVLEHYGYRVLVAADPTAALKIWAKEKATVDLLLTDLVIPGGMTGYELAEQLLVDTPALKVIYTSGYSEQIARLQLHRTAGRNFLQKPCSSATLLATVRRCLDDVASPLEDVTPRLDGTNA